MPCGGCSKRKAIVRTNRQNKEEADLMGGYANLTDRQIKARLEVYKRRYCEKCNERYDCDYSHYVECRKARIK